MCGVACGASLMGIGVGEMGIGPRNYRFWVCKSRGEARLFSGSIGIVVWPELRRGWLAARLNGNGEAGVLRIWLLGSCWASVVGEMARVISIGSVGATVYFFIYDVEFRCMTSDQENPPKVLVMNNIFHLFSCIIFIHMCTSSSTCKISHPKSGKES